MVVIRDLILRGFNPDPSIIRVGADYYIATSTFEWFPGVQIHHSRDLINWELITHPLNRISQLDMRGNPDSCGVWAPCLSYDQDTFYLVYSNVRSFDGVWKDTPNYLVTTDEIRGEWSEPIYLNASGFDGSLFHDKNGKKWYLSMLVDHRKGKFFGGIILQEFDPLAKQLVGPVHHIFEGSELGKTEGPHLYQKDDWYYLITAEGGTEYGHAVSLARSREITGPYEIHPENPVLCATNEPTAPLQKTGHADLVADAQGNWYLVCLTGRPLTPLGRCTLGRETIIEQLHWPENEWPTLKAGGKLARTSIPVPHLSSASKKHSSIHQTDFDKIQLDLHFQSLRVPITDDWLSLSERKGWLRLYGRESLNSLNRQSLIARRIQDFHVEAATCVDFLPRYFQQMAGLVCYYNSYHWHYLAIIGGDMPDEKYLQIMSCDKHAYSESLVEPLAIPQSSLVYLKVHIRQAQLQFYYALEKKNQALSWKAIGSVLDASILSDDYVRDEGNRYRPAFTGAFVGICCQDVTGKRQFADFDWFEYKEIAD